MKIESVFLTMCLLGPVVLSISAQSSYITLQAEKLPSEPGAVTNSYHLKNAEIAELVSFPFDYENYINGSSTVGFVKGTNTFSFTSLILTGSRGYLQPLVVTGPAELRLVCQSGKGFATFKVSPESFPPDKTIIIPEGTGARIALESSTNLTHWTEVYSETHTNSPSNKFFRIKAERLP